MPLLAYDCRQDLSFARPWKDSWVTVEEEQTLTKMFPWKGLAVTMSRERSLSWQRTLGVPERGDSLCRVPLTLNRRGKHEPMISFSMKARASGRSRRASMAGRVRRGRARDSPGTPPLGASQLSQGQSLTVIMNWP